MHKGGGRKKPTEDSPFTTLPPAALPRSLCFSDLPPTFTPGPSLPCNLRKQRYVCWASLTRQVTTSSRFPCMGFCKERVSAHTPPTPEQGAAKTLDLRGSE